MSDISITLPTGEQVYNSIMIHIEPDLLTENYVLLDEKYAQETSDEYQNRVSRYKQALKKYTAAAEAYFASLHTEVESYKQSVAQASLQQDAVILQEVSANINSDEEQ